MFQDLAQAMSPGFYLYLLALFVFPVLVSGFIFDCHIISCILCIGLKYIYYLTVFVDQEAGWAWPIHIFCFSLSQKTAAKVSVNAEVSSEGLTGEGSASKLMWFLEELSSLWVVGLRALLSSISRRPSLVPSHLNLSMGRLTIGQLLSSKPAKKNLLAR